MHAIPPSGGLLNQMNNFMTKGISIVTKSGLKIRFRLIPICFPLDSVARPIASNRTQYNGYFGCSWCYIVSKAIGKVVKYFFSLKKRKVLSEERTHEKYLADAKKAMKENEQNLRNKQWKNSKYKLLP